MSHNVRPRRASRRTAMGPPAAVPGDARGGEGHGSSVPVALPADVASPNDPGQAPAPAPASVPAPEVAVAPVTLSMAEPAVVRSLQPAAAIALAQVTELWTRFGELNEIWFDGGYTSDMKVSLQTLLQAKQPGIGQE